METSPASFRLPAEVELALFWVVQECLTNVHRHSHSSTAEVRIQEHSSAILLEIGDSGRGIPAKLQVELLQGGGKTGVGLSGIRERVAELNGSMDIDSNNNGTTLRIRVPRPAQPIQPEALSRRVLGVVPFARSAAHGKA